MTATPLKARARAEEYAKAFRGLLSSVLRNSLVLSYSPCRGSQPGLEALYLAAGMGEEEARRAAHMVVSLLDMLLLFHARYGAPQAPGLVEALHAGLIRGIDDLVSVISGCLLDVLRGLAAEGRVVLAGAPGEGGPPVVFLVRRGRVDPSRLGGLVEELFEEGLLPLYRALLAPLGVDDVAVMPGGAYVRLGGEPVPVPRLGDGMIELMEALAGAVYAGRGGWLLVEEPEAGLHPGYMSLLATVLVDAALGGGWVLVSTHSIEFIEFLLRAAKERGALGEAAVHVMSRGGVAASYRGDEALEVLDVIGGELRGL